MPWIGSFIKDEKRPTDSNIGIAKAEWEAVQGEGVIYTYTQAVNGVDDKAEFKANAEAGRDKYLADIARNATLSTALTNFLNG